MESSDKLILTAVGPDRVGLVEKISEFISQREGNIDDSKMAVFCGEFALILLISGSPASLLRIAGSASELEALTQLAITVKKPSSALRREPCRPYRLTASCMDHPGVVYRVSHALSQMAINIEAMETTTYLAPVSGTPIFRMEASLSVPVELNINHLKSRLAEIEREENIDIELSPLNP
ncbi:MAG: ACT domain-containing protein [Acidobacteriota bacterium]